MSTIAVTTSGSIAVKVTALGAPGPQGDDASLSLAMSRSGRDAWGLYTTTRLRRPDGTLAVQSVLSGGTAPLYTTRTVTAYASDGETVASTTVYAITYNEFDEFASEAVA